MLKNRKKIIFALFFLIISIAFFVQAFGKSNSKNENRIVIGDVASNNEIVEVKNVEVQKEPEIKVESRASATSNEIITKTQNAEIIIFDKKIEFSFKEGDSLFDVMSELKNSGQISFDGKEFNTMGFFVEEINGFKQLPRERKYWHYYVNNIEASVGISNYKLKNNDSIHWKLEAYK